MKYIVYGIVSAAIMFLSVLMFLTVEGRTDHEKTLEEAVSLALDQTMQEQWMQAESIKGDEAWADAFCRIVKEKMQGLGIKGECKVEIYGVDSKNGLLSVGGTETYRHPNGTEGTYQVIKTALWDQKMEKEDHEVRFYVDDRLWQAYRVEDGADFILPQTPAVEGRKFLGWSRQADQWSGEAFPAQVKETQTYYACFE